MGKPQTAKNYLMTEEIQKLVTVSETNCYRYLLGRMAEDEILDFDEVCFADDACAEELEAIREELIDRYLQKDLSVSDRRDFENYFLVSPHHRKKLEFSKSLMANFAQKRSFWAAFAERANFGAIANFFSAANLKTASLAVASLLILLFGFWLLISWLSKPNEIVLVPNNNQNLNQNITLPPSVTPNSNEKINLSPNENKNITNKPTNSETPKKTPEANTEITDTSPVFVTFLPIPALRATGGEKPLVIGKNFSAVRLQIDAPADKSKKYFVSIRTADGAEVWKSPINVGKNSKIVFLTVPAKVFSNNDYKLEVFESDNAQESVDAYSFRVEKKNR